jgi:hypothetical protein
MHENNLRLSDPIHIQIQTWLSGEPRLLFGAWFLRVVPTGRRADLKGDRFPGEDVRKMGLKKWLTFPV